MKDVFTVIAGRAGNRQYVADSDKDPIDHKADDLVQIRDQLWEHVQYNHIRDGIDWITPKELHRGMMLDPAKLVRDSVANAAHLITTFRKIVKDSFVKDSIFNPITGMGTSVDPGQYNYMNSPVIMDPNQASAFYSSGGIPQVIIDKKAKGVLLNGYTYEGSGWTPDEIKALKEGGELLNVGEAYTNVLRDGLVFGGAFAYPALKLDNAYTTGMDLPEMLAYRDDQGRRLIDKDCIDHFANADRWNCVLVPNYDVTARDYLYPRSIYVPIGGVRVATARGAVVRPKMLPYWDAIRQIGWTTPDFEGWIKPLKAYEIIIASIPIMAQQMSLLMHSIPMDSIVAQDGINQAQQFMSNTQAALDSWSMAQPRAMSMFGELKVIERHYEGFNDLVIVSRQHVAGSCSIPESVIFHTQPTGFSDNKEDVLLKQSEAVKLVSIQVKPQLAPMVRMLALSVFGPDYVDAAGVPILKKLHTLNVLFEVPIMQTPKELADSGTKFMTCLQTAVQAGVPLGAAVPLTKLFFPNVEIPADVMTQINSVAAVYSPEALQTPGGGMRELMRMYPEAALRIQQIMLQEAA